MKLNYNLLKTPKKLTSLSGFKVSLILLLISFLILIVDLSIVEIFWFKEVGYLDVYQKGILIRVGLQVFLTSLSLVFFNGNFYLIRQSLFRENTNQLSLKQSPAIQLRMLVLLGLGLSAILTWLLLQDSQIAFNLWQLKDEKLSGLFWSRNFSIIVPSYPQLISFGLLTTSILMKPESTLKVISWLLSILLGWILSEHWTWFGQFLNPTDFKYQDPIFHNDISFYIFQLPTWQILFFWLQGVILYGLVACFILYLFSENSLSKGRFLGFSRFQLRHLYALGGLMLLTLSFGHILGRYELLYSPRAINYGASYTDSKIQLPVEALSAITAFVMAIGLFWKSLTGLATRQIIVSYYHKKTFRLSSTIWLIMLYLSLYIGGSLLSEIVQIFIVQPNELAKETPYIERTIEATRQAFNLNQIEAKTFDPQNNLTLADLKNNSLTINNIRLWDSIPLLQSNRQLQQIRPYYSFPSASIDRYTLLSQNNQSTSQQILITARELDYNTIPKPAKTWINQHLVYTHGYGFTVSPVNKVAESGLPYYLVKDIGDDGNLVTSNPLIRKSIPINQPRLYYGELDNNYILTSTKVKEFDFPVGEENSYNTYQGKGGVPITSFWQRLVFSVYFRDIQMLVTENFTPDTRLLMRRNIRERVQKIAPFLHYDSYPYLVAADGFSDANTDSNNYLYWIMDAYTTSPYYPYSDPGKNKFNYIRNSVKVVIDAYNGEVYFYVADSTDPVIQTWKKIFPNLFKSLEEMPLNLQLHIRYPEDFFDIQSKQLLTYHMIDPKVFYNREDQWQIPQEIYGKKAQDVKPYYLIMKLPETEKEEFILLMPYTPIGNFNLIAWLAARSDQKYYEKMLLYQFPKEKLIYGPNQIEALINQDPEISEQISLWNREGSRVLQGNLLIIPIEQSLLYVEPLYLEAEENGVPTLVRVIVTYNGKAVMEKSLTQALERVFEK